MWYDTPARLFTSRDCLVGSASEPDMSREIQEQRAERLTRRDDAPREVTGYSRFVRIMRLALPLAAISMVAVLFVVTGGENTAIVPVTQTQDIPEKKIAKNELLHPEFESRDKKNQPYKITADRAVQGESNKDLIMLEHPIGLMTMENGTQIKMHSDTGAYRQDTERFFLEGGVFLEHAKGYTLSSEEAHVDLKQNFAWSEKAVHGTGPDLSIEATGVQANGKTGRIVFTGPAKLVLQEGLEGMK